MDQKRTDLDEQSISLLYLMRNKSEIDLILAGIKNPVDLTQDERTTCVSEESRAFLIKGLMRAAYVFQVLDRQVFDNGKTMKDSCKTKFKEQLQFLDGKIKEIKETGVDSLSTDDIIELAAVVNHCNALCVPDGTTPLDVVSFLF
jgi:hypothetical protein